jgi:hypothetical protein
MSMDGDYTPEPVNLNDAMLAVPVLHEDPAVITHHWYCPWPGSLRDFKVSAQKSADATGQTQRVHFHAAAEECGAHTHATITPDPVRRAALTRG